MGPPSHIALLYTAMSQFDAKSLTAPQLMTVSELLPWTSVCNLATANKAVFSRTLAFEKRLRLSLDLGKIEEVIAVEVELATVVEAVVATESTAVVAVAVTAVAVTAASGVSIGQGPAIHHHL